MVVCGKRFGAVERGRRARGRGAGEGMTRSGLGTVGEGERAGEKWTVEYGRGA